MLLLFQFKEFLLLMESFHTRFRCRDYLKVAPEHSFIHVSDFESMKALADYLVYLKYNETAFAQYLWWKDHYRIQIFNHLDERTDEMLSYVPEHLNPICRFCKTINEYEPKHSKPYSVFSEFWSKGRCRNP